LSASASAAAGGGGGRQLRLRGEVGGGGDGRHCRSLFAVLLRSVGFWLCNAMQMEFVVPQVGLGVVLFIDRQVESSSVRESCACLFSRFA
jgi:hypothetical protein